MSSTSEAWGEAIASILAVGVVLFGVWFVVCGIMAGDLETFDKIDNKGNCYVRTHEVNNMWLTPGDSYTTRDIYCRE